MNQRIASKIAVGRARTPRLPQRRTATGATRLETIGALLLAALLLGVAAPSMTATMDSVKLSSASGLLLSGLQLARQQAIAGNVRVVLCKSANGVSCAGAGGWEQGWIVFQDANANGAREQSEVIVRRESRLSSRLSVYGTGSLVRSVSFGPGGPTRPVDGGKRSGVLRVCSRSAGGSEAREIVLDAAGRAHIRRAAANSCA
jgi:type IV fimbrial biogenesis protein FimT